MPTLLTRFRERDFGPIKGSEVSTALDGKLLEFFKTQGYVPQVVEGWSEKALSKLKEECPVFVPMEKDELAVYSGRILGQDKDIPLVAFGSREAELALRTIVKGNN